MGDRGYGYDSHGGDRWDRHPVIESMGGPRGGPPHLERSLSHAQSERLGGVPQSDRQPYQDGVGGGGGGYPTDGYDPGFHPDPGQFDRYGGGGHPLPPPEPAPGHRDFYDDRRGPNQYTANRNYNNEDDFHSMRQRYDEEY